MLAVIGASGKIGGATLSALLERNLYPKDQIVALTSSKEDSQKWTSLSSKGIQVRYGTFDDANSLKTALQGVEKLFLVSSPRIELDYDPVVPAPPGQGREKDHYAALDAAKNTGVKHIYYTSLAFANPSKSNVMTAHERTEERLGQMEKEGAFDVTILREGLYNESWPLYLGYFDPENDERTEVVLADEGDRRLSWTSIKDLGIASAMIVAGDGAKWKGKCVYLSRTEGARSMKQVAELVGKALGKSVSVKTVDVKEHVRHYAQDRGRHENAVKWWVATYSAVKDGECEITDNTFDNLMSEAGVRAVPIEATIEEMASR